MWSKSLVGRHIRTKIYAERHTNALWHPGPTNIGEAWRVWLSFMGVVGLGEASSDRVGPKPLMSDRQTAIVFVPLDLVCLHYLHTGVGILLVYLKLTNYFLNQRSTSTAAILKRKLLQKKSMIIFGNYISFFVPLKFHSFFPSSISNRNSNLSDAH